MAPKLALVAATALGLLARCRELSGAAARRPARLRAPHPAVILAGND
jgi:hypothetical protein